MKKYCVFILAMMLIISLLVIGCSQGSTSTTTSKPAGSTPQAQTSSSTSPLAAQVKTFKFSYTMPKGLSIAQGFEWFATEFPKRTGGRYKIETYPGSTLVSMPAALDAVKKGVAEIMMTSSGGTPSNWLLTSVIGIPTMGMPADRVWDGSAQKAYWDLYNTFPEVQSEFKDTKLIWLNLSDPMYLITKGKQVHAAADLKGMKVGGSGASLQIISANGGAGVQQLPPDSYLNMDKGVTDGCFSTWGWVRDYKLHEIADYFYTQEFGNGNQMVLMTPSAWNSMPAADQKIFMDTFNEANAECMKGSKSAFDEGLKNILGINKKITEPTASETAAWKTAAQPAIDKWMADAKTGGVDQATIDKVLAGWKQITQKYNSGK
jgi:TRAP-type transport system periplasmic protein